MLPAYIRSKPVERLSRLMTPWAAQASEKVCAMKSAAALVQWRNTISGSGAGLREITGDYRTGFTHRPRVTWKVSAPPVSAGSRRTQGGRRSGRGRWLLWLTAQNIDPCYQASSHSLAALLGALERDRAPIESAELVSGLSRNDNMPGFQAKEHTQGARRIRVKNILVWPKKKKKSEFNNPAASWSTVL